MAQNSASVPRISGPIEESALITLKGNVPLRAKAQFDRGEAGASTQLTHIRLVLSRSSEQQSALDKYMAELQSKSSPNYHKWLTPEQFGTLYGPADSDVAAIVAWLQSHGLKLENVSPGRTNIAFSGTVNQVEEAFHTVIHSFQADGEPFISNVTNPSIPEALAAVVIGVAHLDTIKPLPHHAGGGMGRFDPDLGRLTTVSSETSNGPKPQLTIGSSPNFSLYVVPGDAATIYDTPNSRFNANFATGTTYDGTGVAIGVGGDAIIQATTVAAFRSKFLGDSIPPIVTNVDGVTSTADADEAYIDTELAGGLAPGATIHFYTSTDLVSAIQQAINDNTVSIFSLSFGACELGLTTAQNALVNGWWQQAATQGIAVTVSTGDNGSAACDDPSSQFSAVNGLQVNGFASTPYNIAVGGTDTDGLARAFAKYANTASSPGVFYRSAISYIPESAWNDAIQGSTAISANIPVLDSKNNANIVAASGGISSCSTNTDTATTTGTCTSGYSKPSWQRGTGVPSDGVRDLPDVSLISGNGVDLSSWLVCTDGTGIVGGSTITTNCVTQSNNQFYFSGFGGTSTAAPTFAGILALVQQKTGSRLGQAAKELYDLYNGSHAAAIFHDVTLGNNSVPCTAGTPNCTKNSAGYLFLTGYDTSAGYDLATGLGSVDAAQLVNFWATATGSAAATVTVNPSLTTLLSNQSLSVVASVTGSGTPGTPTGTVTLSGGGFISPVQTLSAGSYTFTIPSNALSGGTDTLAVAYNGDSNYATAVGTATVTVTASVYALAASAPGAVAAGGNTTSTVSVSSSTGYAGTVTLSCALTSSPVGAAHTPTCVAATGSSSIALSGSTTTATGTVTISTTAAIAKLEQPGFGGWTGAGGGAVLALLVFVGIPARRRSWQSMLGVMAVMVALGSLAGCGGGGGSSGGGGGGGTPGTTAGAYTFTVTGTGNPAVTPAPTTTITLTVN